MALKRKATQSTTLGYGSPGVNSQPADHSAGLAVDGVLTSTHPRCAHTDHIDVNPWWSVDIGQNAVIFKLRLLNRDLCGNYNEFIF